MIEDIKKELKILFMTYVITPCPDYMKKDTRSEIEIRGDIVTTIKLVNEILDKYKDSAIKINEEGITITPDLKELLKYKNAWGELKQVIISDTKHLRPTMRDIEQKHNIVREE